MKTENVIGVVLGVLVILLASRMLVHLVSRVIHLGIMAIILVVIVSLIIRLASGTKV